MRASKLHVLLLTSLVLTPAAGAVWVGVDDAGDWNDGSFSGTTETDGGLEVSAGNAQGSYTSKVFDTGDNYTWSGVKTVSDLGGGSAELTVKVSRDGFSTVLDSETFSLSGGSETFDLSNLSEARYARFNYTLSGDSRVNSTKVVLAGDTHFIIRSEPCQSDELEIFSMSGRSNAHASSPGFYPYRVCGSGFQERHFTTVCASEDTAVLSFFGSEEVTSHLATDPEMFNYKLCTGKLTVAVRKFCPDTTKSLVSIYHPGQSHVAEPGYYPYDLCGAFFDSVTTMLKFQFGNDTVYMNSTRDPAEGLYRDEEGRDSWFVAAQNASLIAGIVAGESTETTAVGYREAAQDHVFNMTQDRGEVSYYLPFTEASYLSLVDRAGLIESGDFLSKINPNFAYGFADEMLVQLTLSLPGIDLVSGTELSPGIYGLMIENLGTNAEGEPEVRVNATR